MRIQKADSDFFFVPGSYQDDRASFISILVSKFIFLMLMKEVLIFADVSMIEVTMIIPARLTTQRNLIF